MKTAIPELQFEYTLEFERERVRYTLNKGAWFREKGYNPTFPGGKRLPDIDLSVPNDDIIDLVEVEYDEAFYASMAAHITERWKWFIEHWPHEEIAKTTLMFQPSYKISLTRYGVGGSYWPPNQITLNINRGDWIWSTQTIVHEMIHLAIEELIQKHNVAHWHKERTVDLLYKKLFPEIAREQNLPEATLIVDPVFNEHYGNIEEIMKRLAANTDLLHRAQ